MLSPAYQFSIRFISINVYLFMQLQVEMTNSLIITFRFLGLVSRNKHMYIYIETNNKQKLTHLLKRKITFVLIKIAHMHYASKIVTSIEIKINVGEQIINVSELPTDKGEELIKLIAEKKE